MKLSKLLIITFAFSAAGQASSAPIDDAQVVRPDLIATYKSEVVARGHKPQITVWTLERRPDRVEICERKHDTGEIWRRDQAGNISFERVFHKQRRIVDYTASDLRSLESYPSWQRVSEIADAQLFGSTLKRAGSTRAFGKTAERYKGRSGELDVEIVWLTNERLPY